MKKRGCNRQKMPIIKLLIEKRFPTRGDWMRYREVGRVQIDTDSSVIKTEKQICKYIFDRFGDGNYKVIAWTKGYEGFWLFWIGDIMEQGFIRNVRKNNKEIEYWKDEWNKADSYEEKESIEEIIEDVRKDVEKNKKLESRKRRGPWGFKLSRPGILHNYDDEELGGIEI
jgi:hypothetical protein